MILRGLIQLVSFFDNINAISMLATARMFRVIGGSFMSQIETWCPSHEVLTVPNVEGKRLHQT